MHSSINLNYRRRARVGGYALTEVLVCVFIMMVVYGGAVLAYVQTCKRAEWSGLSLSAQGLGVRQLEQARAAKWDTQAATAVDLVTNVAGQASLALDLPIQGTNVYYATNYTTVGTLTLKTNTGMAANRSNAADCRFVRRARRICVPSTSAHFSTSHTARCNRTRRSSNCCFNSGLKRLGDIASRRG